MKILLIFCLALIGSMISAQSVIVKGTGAGAVLATGAGSVRGVATPRFTIPAGNTNVVIDNNSGLTWTRDANIGGQMNWTSAVAYCSNLTHATYSDWRLPSIPELSRDGTYGATNGFLNASSAGVLLPAGHPFVSIPTDENYYWSSTSVSGAETTHAHAVLIITFPGQVSGRNQANSCYVWPCRAP